MTVIRRVDDNWAEGMLGDKIGIFPILYVEVRERVLNDPSGLVASKVTQWYFVLQTKQESNSSTSQKLDISVK